MAPALDLKPVRRREIANGSMPLGCCVGKHQAGAALPLTHLGMPVKFSSSLPRRPFVSTSSATVGDEMEKAAKSNHEIELGERSELRPYQKPSIRIMDEKEVLSAFQVTVAGTTWWVM